MQALYDLRHQQQSNLQVRAGMEGVLQEVSVAAGQQIGPGTILARVTNSSRLMARVNVPEAQAGQVELNQRASISLQDRTFPARVVHVDPNVQNGTVSIDLKFIGGQPREARSDLSVSGAIELERLPQATYVKWPLKSHAGEPISLFRVAPDGSSAARVSVVLGKSSDDAVEISDGLAPGDRIIVSDTSAWKSYDRLQLK